MAKIKNKFIFTLLFITAMLLAGSVMAKTEQNHNKKQLTDNAMANSATTSASTTEDNNRGQTNAQEHRSIVANFVQSLIKAADREKGGIGEQVREVARAQNQIATTTAETINNIEKRNKIKTFLFGSDYRNLGALRSAVVQTRNHLKQLNSLSGQLKNASSTEEIKNQVQVLEQEQTKIENFVKAQEGKFSLFGWLAKLFNK